MSGGTAESSQPSQASFSPGMRAVAPRPDSRTFQSCSSSASSSKSFIDGGFVAFFSASISAWALSSASSLVSPPNSTSSQPPPVGQQRDVLGMDVLLLHVLDEDVVEPFQADRPGFEDLRDVVARAVDVGVAEHQQRPGPAGWGPGAAGLEDGDAGALRADERPGDVEAVLGQQVVEVVARDAAREVLGIAAADLVGVAVAQGLEPRVDLAPAAAVADDPLELLLARSAPTVMRVPS